MAGRKMLRISSGSIMGKNLSSGSVDECAPSSLGETRSCYRGQFSERELAGGAAVALQNAAGTAVESLGEAGQPIAAAATEANAVTSAAPIPGEAGQTTGACDTAGDGRDDDCPIGSPGGVLRGGAVENTGSEGDENRHFRHEPRTVSRPLLLFTPAAQGVDGSFEPATTAITAEVTTMSSAALSSTTMNSADVLAGVDGGMPSLAGASIADSSGVSGSESATPVKRRTCSSCEYVTGGSNGVDTKSATLVKRRTFSSCEECIVDNDTLVTEGARGGEQTQTTPRFAEDWSASADHMEITRAGTAYESCTNSSTSDCCGCVGPTVEASGGNVAGVPPYLRIESLPAMLEEGSGGRMCVLLGEKKEALLYSVATPFGLNRWVLVCIYMLYAFLTGCVYFGWPSMSYMLLTSGAYSWRCPRSSSGEFINDLRKSQNGSNSVDNGSGGAGENGTKYYICDEQDAAVGPLFTIAYVTQSLMSVVAGTLLDHVSPKHAAVLGQLLNATGWVLLACSSYSFQAYIPAMVFIGLGADTAYLPTLLIAALFPGKRATVITLLGSANTASFAVPMLLEALWKANPEWQFSRICWLYLGLGPVFCCLLAALFIPRASFGSAAVRRLPLQQQQQSPLHSNRRDALLTAVDTPAKEHRWGPRESDSKSYCCYFSSSHKRQQEREHVEHWSEHAGTSFSSGMSRCCCCHDVDQGREMGETTVLSRAQGGAHLRVMFVRGSRLLFPAFYRLLQQISRLRRYCSRTVPDSESQPSKVSMTQQQEPPLLRRDSRQSQPSDNCLRPVDGICRGAWITEENAAGEDSFTSTPSTRAEVSTSEAGIAAGIGPVATDTTGGTDLDVKSSASALHRTTNAVNISSFKFHAGGEKSRDTLVVTPQTDNTCDVCVAGGSGGGRCGCSWFSGPTDKEKACRRASGHSAPEHDINTPPAFHRRQPRFSFSSFFKPLSNAEEEPEMVPRPQHWMKYMFARSVAEENKTKAERRIHPPVADISASAAGAAVPGHPSAVTEDMKEDDEPSFCSQLLSSHFMCIVLYWSGMAVAISYFQSTASRLFSTKALDFMDVALSFSFVPCVLLGKMIDLFGPFPALFLVNTMGVLTYCCALAGGSQQSVLQYVSILAFCVYVSVDSEQVFCYVENTFSAKHFGKLSGLALTTGGVISLVSIPLYEEVTIRLLHKNPLPVCCGLMIVLILLYFTLGSMWFVRLKHPPAFKAKQKRPETADASTAYARGRGSADGIECVATDVEEFEEAYAAIDNGSTGVVTGHPGCTSEILNPLGYCCCGPCHESPRRATTMSDNVISVKMQGVTINAETTDSCRLRGHGVALRWLLKRLTHVFRAACGQQEVVEVMSQRTAEPQKQREGRAFEGPQDDRDIEVV